MTQRSAKRHWVRNSVAMVIAALVALPVALVSVSAFKSPSEFASTGPWNLPATWTTENFGAVMGDAGMGASMLRSALAIGFLLATQVPVSLLAAYAFAWGRFRWRRQLYAVTVATLIIPAVSLVMPLYLMSAAAGVRETFWGLVVPYSLGSAFAVVILREQFVDLPRDQVEAARLDGAGEVAILWKIVAPQSIPVIAVVVVATVVTHWNAYLWPQIIAGTRWPVAAVTTASLQGQYSSNWTEVLAGCVLMFVPMLVLFALIQAPLKSMVLSGRHP
jgi:multiple sugar transport system permease protein